MIRLFRYDVAFSFSEKNRSVAEAIVCELKKQRFRSYYLYTEKQAEQWGKDLFQITVDVYRRSRIVLIICSNDYLAGYWSGIEQKAMTSNFKRIQGRILPLRIDEAKLTNLPGTIIYQKWDNNAVAIARDIISRVKGEKKKERFPYIILSLGIFLATVALCVYFIFTKIEGCKSSLGVDIGNPVLIDWNNPRKEYDTVDNERGDTFYVSNTEVTVREFKRFCDSFQKRLPIQPSPQIDNNPVVNITWDEAQAYCKWRGGRLPSEEEWSYAASAGLADKYSGGNNAKRVAVFGVKRFQPVAKKCPNRFGLYDMSGNVAEWCDKSVDSLGKLMIAKGGSHMDKINFLLISARDTLPRSDHFEFVGFRVVWDKKSSIKP